MPDVMIARTGGVVRVNGERRRVYRGRTTAHVDAQVVADYPELWRPITVDFPAELDYPAAGAATVPASPAPVAAPVADEAPVADDTPQPPADAPVAAERPSAKAVRAWARSVDLDVPERGRVPDELVDAYLEAHED